MRAAGALSVPPIGLGCNNFGVWCDEAASLAVVDAAFEVGATFFDTADYYGDGRSEEVLGQALKGRRDGAVVATKFGIMGSRPGAARADAAFIVTSAEDSLRRLQTDRIDLYQLHFPDPNTPIDETLEALDRLVTAGKVVEVGACNLSAAQIDEAADAAAAAGVRPFATVQGEWSLLRRRVESEVVPAARRHGLAFIPYFPLASGLLTGKYRGGEVPPGSRFDQAPALGSRYLTDADLTMVEQLDAYAAEQGHSLLELALSWLAFDDTVATVIVGATKPEQVHANVTAASWQLSEAERAAVDALTRVS